MSGPAFTPGPWCIFREKARDGLLTIGVRGPFGPKKHIAEMCWAKDVADKETGATGHSDARLIAASPRLYLALEKLANRTIEYVGAEPTMDGLECDDEMRALAKDALAVLAEVRGEA